MQKRFYAVVLAFLLTSACVKEKEPFKFPRNLSQGWTLHEESAIPESATPESLRALSFHKAYRAEYRGPRGTFTATVYEAAAEAVAFEAAQKWRNRAGQMSFHKDSYFAILEANNLDDAWLGPLLQELESAVAAWGK